MSPDDFKRLIAAGLTTDQVAIVMEMMERDAKVYAEAEDARKVKGRERVAKWRLEHSRNATEMQPNVTVPLTRGDAHVEDKTSTSVQEPKKVSEAKRAFRLAEDWTLPAEWRGDAVKAGLPESAVDLEAAKLRDWSRSAPKGAKLEWRPAWRNWCREAASRLPQPRAGPPRSNPGLAAVDALMEKIDAVTSGETQGYPPYPRLVARAGG